MRSCERNTRRMLPCFSVASSGVSREISANGRMHLSCSREDSGVYILHYIREYNGIPDRDTPRKCWDLPDFMVQHLFWIDGTYIFRQPSSIKYTRRSPAREQARFRIWDHFGYLYSVSFRGATMLNFQILCVLYLVAKWVGAGTPSPYYVLLRYVVLFSWCVEDTII